MSFISAACCLRIHILTLPITLLCLSLPGLRFSSHEAESYDDFNDRYQLFFEQAPDLFEVQVRQTSFRHDSTSAIASRASCSFRLVPLVTREGKTCKRRGQGESEKALPGGSSRCCLPDCRLCLIDLPDAVRSKALQPIY